MQGLFRDDLYRVPFLGLEHLGLYTESIGDGCWAFCVLGYWIALNRVGEIWDDGADVNPVGVELYPVVVDQPLDLPCLLCALQNHETVTLQLGIELASVKFDFRIAVFSVSSAEFYHTNIALMLFSF